VRTVHEHFGFDDRHDVLFLAQRRVAGERVGVGFDRKRRRYAGADIDHRPPLGKARAELKIFDQPLAQAVQSLGDGLGRKAGQRLGAHVDLDARHDAELGQMLSKRHARTGFLPQRFVVQDHTADPLLDARRRKQQLAVGLAVIGRRFEIDLVESLLDRPGTLIGRQNPLVLGHHGQGYTLQIAVGHRRTSKMGLQA
jgi:hypothetical protein